MAAQKVTPTGILAKLGNRLTGAMDKVLGAKAEYGNIALPAGIEHGIAKLVEAKIGIFEQGEHKGKPFFYAAGIVVEPAEFTPKGESVPMQLRGMRTQLQVEPLCDTPEKKNEKARKTFEEHFAWFRNQVLLLSLAPGAPLESFWLDRLRRTAKTPEEIDRGIQAGLAALVKAKPYFRFRTWAGSAQEIQERGGKFFVFSGKNQMGGPFNSKEQALKVFPNVGKDPLVNHQWQGLVTYNVQVSPTAGVQDTSGDVGNGQLDQTEVEQTIARDAHNASELPQSSVDADEEGLTPENEFTDPLPPTDPSSDGDPAQNDATDLDNLSLDDLAALADTVVPEGEENPEVEEAGQRIWALAKEAGVEEADCLNADNYAAMVELIKVAMEGAGDGSAENVPTPTPSAPAAKVEAKEKPPEVGWTYKYLQLDEKGQPVKNLRTKKPEKPVDVEVLTVNSQKKTVTLKNMVTGKPVMDAKGKLALQVPWDKLILT